MNQTGWTKKLFHCMHSNIMCPKQFLFSFLAVVLVCPSGYKPEIVSTTHHPNIQQDYQEKILLVLNEISKQLSKPDKCQENQVLLEKQTILETQLSTETQKRVELEAALQTLTKNFTQLQTCINISACERKSRDDSNISGTSCYDIFKSGNTVSEVYLIRPNHAPEPFPARCNMDVQGGGWTYLLNRNDGSQNFYLKWEDYKKGFGDLNGEFWLGLEHLYELTGFEDNELLVEVVDWNDKKAYALYEQFRVGSESEGYSIKTLKGFTGDAGDSLTYHLGSKFTTNDRDNDKDAPNCAVTYHGAWWYHSCYLSQLTGTYFHSSMSSTQGMNWRGFRDINSLKEARMMIRSRNKL